MKPKITIQATVAAPLAKAWQCYTEPAHIVNWNFAIDTWHCPKAENDLRTGGKFSFTMAAKDGSFSFNFEGVYDEVALHKKIAYTMPDGRKAEVLFEPNGNETTVTTIFDPEDMNPVEMQQGGWQAILDNFKKHTEAQ